MSTRRSPRPSAHSGPSAKPEERLERLRRVVEVYKRGRADLGQAVSREMAAPAPFALQDQVGIGLAHLEKMVDVLGRFEFSRMKVTLVVVKEPIGVVGLITPWNWPLNQITCKVAPALAAGCTMVLKPSEIAPLDAIIFAEIVDEAGVPAGVFNLVNAKAADAGIPFGGYKQSGNGREYAEYGLEDFRETKGILGYASA